MLATSSNAFDSVELINDIIEEEELIESTVSGVFSPEQVDYIMSLLEKIDIYSDYIMGFFLFFVLVILLYFTYRFFKIFF